MNPCIHTQLLIALLLQIKVCWTDELFVPVSFCNQSYLYGYLVLFVQYVAVEVVDIVAVVLDAVCFFAVGVGVVFVFNDFVDCMVD